MRMRMLKHVSGLRDGWLYPPVGGILELVDGDDGSDLLRNKYAEPIEEIIEEIELVPIEVATVAPPENTALRTTAVRRGRPPKAG